MKQIEILATKDGSNTVIHPILQETYHSVNGAINESVHVFINAGLAHCLAYKPHLNVLEIGFGTGLNALMTLRHIYNRCHSVNYVGLEPFPLEYNLVAKLDYLSELHALHLQTHFEKMHLSEFNKTLSLENNFFFTKKEKTLQLAQLEKQFDLVYYDAFAPSAQPELWETEVLTKVKEAMVVGGVLVTYCAKGKFKRLLKALDFEVEALSGPPGKREMTRAIRK
ncbi:MAG: tRNA (5-methylaminomethyl-2-thiouridine)(34)-methyltransferase MnmD [Thermonemataceae bacterium]